MSEWTFEPVEKMPRKRDLSEPLIAACGIVSRFLDSGHTAVCVARCDRHADGEAKRQILKKAVAELQAPVAVTRRSGDVYLMREAS